MTIIKNSKALPQVYYGLHMCEGVAEYAEPGREPYRILINEATLKQMDTTFAGRPLYVGHVDKVDLENLQVEADGYVVKSFFNTADGKHWVEFIAVSDRAQDKIRQGWKLSNAYVPKNFVNGGLWHGVEYRNEITSGEYEHLALVDDPRYSESVILTPEEFKSYNDEKEAELKRLKNSKTGESEMKLNFFKRAKVENSLDLEGICVVLPKSGKEKTITQLVNEMDELEEAKKRNDGLADPSHKVKLHDGSYMNVGELIEAHKKLNEEMSEMKKKNEAKDGEDEEASDDEKQNDAADGDGDADDMQNESEDEKDEGEEKKKNELEAAKKEKEKKAKEKAAALRNAHLKALSEETATVEIMADQVSRGRARYGSN